MIHFIYSVPRSTRGPLRLLEPYEYDLLRRFPRFLPTWRYGLIDFAERPIPAPASITLNLFRYLSARHPTRLYHLAEHTRIHYGPNDIILGHPWPEPGTVTQRAFLDDRPCRCRALIFPIHHNMPEMNRYASEMVDRADIVFGIMGPYWYDTIERSEFAHWRRKLIRLDMAVSTSDYPRVKTQFNDPGKRGYLYIGHTRPYKGIPILERTMAALRAYPRGWIGTGDEIANVDHLSERRALDPSFMRKTAAKYDFFVSPSISDPNPTTILEAMAWGFPVACTPESGYYQMPTIARLSTTDIEHNVRVLTQLQFAPEADLIRLADANRRLVETDYTWERFCGLVWGQLQPRLGFGR